MDKILQAAFLYDFYSGLLTDKQCCFFELYYFDNLSTLEIAEAHGVTPQAVWDLLKRTVRILERYELKLGMVEKYHARRQKIDEITRLVGKAQEDAGLRPESQGAFRQIKGLLEALADEQGNAVAEEAGHGV